MRTRTKGIMSPRRPCSARKVDKPRGIEGVRGVEVGLPTLFCGTEGMDHFYEIMAENFPVYFNTGDACSEHDQYFAVKKQFFLRIEPEKAERIQRARIPCDKL